MSVQPALEITNASTGPRTIMGKARSSQNSLRHGLASGTLLIHGEDPEEFALLLQGLIDEWSPATPTEKIQVENMARHQWLVERACLLQSKILTTVDVAALPPSFAVMLRYQTTNERAFVRAQKTLEAMQQTRKQQDAPPETEFVSQNPFLFKPLPPRDYEKDLEMLRKLRADRDPKPASSPKVATQGAS